MSKCIGIWRHAGCAGEQGLARYLLDLGLGRECDAVANSGQSAYTESARAGVRLFHGKDAPWLQSVAGGGNGWLLC